MLQFRPFDAMPDIVDGIELDNPAMVARIRRAADKLSHYEISAHLANAITGNGASNVLAGLVKKIDRSVTVASVEDPAGLEALLKLKAESSELKAGL